MNKTQETKLRPGRPRRSEKRVDENEAYLARKAQKAAETAAKKAEHEAYLETVELLTRERKAQERIKQQASLPYLKSKQDDLLEWLLDNKPTHPEWDNKVSEFHAVEGRIYAQTAPRPNFSGINELVVGGSV